jgi:ABC-type lipoprotein release transport system permease subunit
VALLPRLESFGLLASADSESRPGFLRGVDLTPEFEHFALDQKISAGSFPTAQRSAVVLAEKLAEKLKLKVGDNLVIIGQGYHDMNAKGKFLISGIANLKNPAANKSTVYLKLADLQELTGACARLSTLVVIPKVKEGLNELKPSLQSQLDAQEYDVLT